MLSCGGCERFININSGSDSSGSRKLIHLFLPRLSLKVVPILDGVLIPES